MPSEAAFPTQFALETPQGSTGLTQARVRRAHTWSRLFGTCPKLGDPQYGGFPFGCFNSIAWKRDERGHYFYEDESVALCEKCNKSSQQVNLLLEDSTTKWVFGRRTWFCFLEAVHKPYKSRITALTRIVPKLLKTRCLLLNQVTFWSPLFLQAFGVAGAWSHVG